MQSKCVFKEIFQRTLKKENNKIMLLQAKGSMSTLFLTYVRNKVDLVSLVCENVNFWLRWPLIHNLSMV